MKQILFILAFLLPLGLFAQSGTGVRLNEVMADPKGLVSLPETEYIELYNDSDQAVSLEGWMLLYGEKDILLDALLLPAKGYVVLYRSGRDIHIDPDGLAMPLDKFPHALANTGKDLALYDPARELVDKLAYEKAFPGVAWERKGNDWVYSQDGRGGTPGSANSHGITEPDPEEPEEPETPEDPEESEEPETPSFASGCLLINEVMPDPKAQTSFPQTEYVELRNTTNQAIPLSGWSFLYGDKATILADQTLDPQGYVLLYRSGRAIHIEPSGIGMPLDKFPSALANTGKELALLDPSGMEIDRITYEKAKSGIAWERSVDGSRFYHSTDPRGGTPGASNSEPETETPEEPEEPDKPTVPEQPEETPVLPGDLIFNELLPNPYSGGSEYIELYNRSENTLSLSGLSIATRKSDGTLSTRYPLASAARRMEPGSYALLTKSIEGVETYYFIPYPDVLHELKLPILANTTASLVLFRTKDEMIIDEVRYTAKWHAPSIKEEKGIALERIDPERPTQEEANWTSAASTEGYGTPGYRNSQYGKTVGDEPTGIDPPTYSEETQSYDIAYRLDQAGYTCRAWIFDTAGKRLQEISNMELLGVSGSLRWDGFSANGTKVHAGIYIFYAELTHPQGETKRYKQVFLVR